MDLRNFGSGDLLALAFEFVNGFHDTANAVATVIYTNTLRQNRRGVVRFLELDRRARIIGEWLRMES